MKKMRTRYFRGARQRRSANTRSQNSKKGSSTRLFLSSRKRSRCLKVRWNLSRETTQHETRAPWLKAALSYVRLMDNEHLIQAKSFQTRSQISISNRATPAVTLTTSASRRASRSRTHPITWKKKKPKRRKVPMIAIHSHTPRLESLWNLTTQLIAVMATKKTKSWQINWMHPL